MPITVATAAGVHTTGAGIYAGVGGAVNMGNYYCSSDDDDDDTERKTTTVTRKQKNKKKQTTKTKQTEPNMGLIDVNGHVEDRQDMIERTFKDIIATKSLDKPDMSGQGRELTESDLLLTKEEVNQKNNGKSLLELVENGQDFADSHPCNPFTLTKCEEEEENTGGQSAAGGIVVTHYKHNCQPLAMLRFHMNMYFSDIPLAKLQQYCNDPTKPPSKMNPILLPLNAAKEGGDMLAAIKQAAKQSSLEHSFTKNQLFNSLFVQSIECQTLSMTCDTEKFFRLALVSFAPLPLSWLKIAAAQSDAETKKARVKRALKLAMEACKCTLETYQTNDTQKTKKKKKRRNKTKETKEEEKKDETVDRTTIKERNAAAIYHRYCPVLKCIDKTDCEMRMPQLWMSDQYVPIESKEKQKEVNKIDISQSSVSYLTHSQTAIQNFAALHLQNTNNPWEAHAGVPNNRVDKLFLSELFALLEAQPEAREKYQKFQHVNPTLELLRSIKLEKNGEVPDYVWLPIPDDDTPNFANMMAKWAAVHIKVQIQKLSKELPEKERDTQGKYRYFSFKNKKKVMRLDIVTAFDIAVMFSSWMRSENHQHYLCNPMYIMMVPNNEMTKECKWEMHMTLQFEGLPM